MPKLDTSSVMFLESLDVSGLSTSYALLQVTQLGLIRPQLVSRWLASYQDSMAPLFWATAILRLSLPHWWYCGWLSSFSLPRCQNYWRLWPRNGLQILWNQPPQGNTLLSNQPADSHWPVLCTWKASSQRLLPSDLPTGLSAPAALLPWWTQTQGQCLVAGWWLQYGNCQSLADVRMPAEVLLAGVQSINQILFV